MWNHSSPDNGCFITASQYTGEKFLKSGLQGNKYDNDNVEIFKSCNPRPPTTLCSPP